MRDKIRLLVGSLSGRIFIALIAGIVLGGAVGESGLATQSWMVDFVRDGVLRTVGDIFVASLKMMVVPMVFTSLVCGVTALGDTARLGVIGAKTIGLYLITTLSAVFFAILAGVTIQPGSGADVSVADFVPKPPPSLYDTIVNLVPSNPIAAMADGNMLQVIVFSILFGIAINAVGERGDRIKEVILSAQDVVLRLIMILVKIAPYGVFALLFQFFARSGFGLFGDVAAYFLTVAGTLVVHLLVVQMLFVMFLLRVSPLRFLRHTRQAMMFAFSTASSNATMPITLQTARNMGVSNRVGSFVVPLGATINMDGTVIMQGVATAFIAQAYGIDIGIGGYLMVVMTATLASIGTAGVPGVGLIMLTMVLGQVGLPIEGIGLIIGVDRLLDMMRTAVNVNGDLMVASIVAKNEGQLSQQQFEEHDFDQLVKETST